MPVPCQHHYETSTATRWVGARRVDDIIISQKTVSPRNSKTVLTNDRKACSTYRIGGGATTLTGCRPSSVKGWPCQCTVKNRTPPFGCRSRESSEIGAKPKTKTLSQAQINCVRLQIYSTIINTSSPLVFLYVYRVLLFLIVHSTQINRQPGRVFRQLIPTSSSSNDTTRPKNRASAYKSSSERL